MGQEVCKNHADAPAVWRCEGCGALFCDHCINRQAVGTHMLLTCPSCKDRVRPLFAPLPRPVRPKSFLDRLPGAFSYPFKGAGVSLLIIGSVFFWFIELSHKVSMIGIIALFGTGYLSAYLLSIIAHTANGEDHMPDWPGFADWWDDILHPYFLVLGATSLSFLPLIAYFLAVLSSRGEPNPLTIVGLIGVGLLYIPMALIGVAVYDTFSGMSPLRVLPAITKTLGPYAAACLMMGAIVVLRVAVGLAVSALPFPLLTSLVAWFISFYLLIVEMRILGLLYLTNEKRIGWFPTG